MRLTVIKTISLLSLLLLTGCAASDISQNSTASVTPYQPHVERIDVPAEQYEEAKRLVKTKLKDPYSAMFEDMYAIRINQKDDSIAYCGLVNAKNSYGGYTGSMPFRVSAFGKVYLWDSRGESFNTAITLYCSGLTGGWRQKTPLSQGS